jgi:predicted HNH restriction endonuclease
MYTPATPPPQSRYVAAIEAIRSDLSDRSIAVLRFQFQHPGRAVTSQDIRDHFGYTSIGASNLLYGSLGKQLATALPMQTEQEGSTRTRFWKSLSTGDGSGDHFIWIMRPELANALVETGLVDPANDGLAMVPDLDIHANTYSAVEGRRKLVLHLVRERNQALVAEKKASAASHACEICGFDSLQKYGEDYCEVHHLTPLAQLVDDYETTLDDLAIVCANCHRIIHLATPPMDIAELRLKVNR